MAHPLRGECDFELDGKTYKLKLDFGEVEALDEATQMGPLQLLQALHPSIARLDTIDKVLYHAIKGDDGKRLALSEVKNIRRKAGFGEAIRAAQRIVTLCLTDPSIKGNADEPDADATATTGE